MKHSKLFLRMIILTITLISYKLSSAFAQVTELSPVQVLQQNCNPTDEVVGRLQFSQDGQYLLANWPPYDVRAWDVKTGTRVATLTNDKVNPARWFTISSNNKYVVMWEIPGVSVLWDTFSGQKIRTFPAQNVKSASFSPDGSSVLVSGMNHTLWKLDSNSEPIDFSVSGEYGEYAEFSTDGTLILTQNDSGRSLPKAHIWDVKTGNLLYTFERTYEAHFSPDSKYIWLDGVDGNILVHTGGFSNAYSFDQVLRHWVFSPDSKYLLGSDFQSTLQTRDVKTGKLLYTLTEQRGIPRGVFFLDEKTVLYVDSLPRESLDTKFSVRDITTGVELRQITFQFPLRCIEDFAVAPDGKYLAMASIDAIISTWDVETGKQVHQYR
jgi:WD40 repeat protein